MSAVLFLALSAVVPAKAAGYDYISDFAIYGYSWGFAFTKDGKNYARINGQVIGPYESEVTGLNLSNNNWGFWYFALGKYYANIKGQIYGPFDDKGSLVVLDENWAFGYTSFGKEYALIKGQIYGPFDDVRELSISESGKWGILYSMNGRDYVKINGQDYGPYDWATHVRVGNPNWGFYYWQGTNYNANINGQVYGPFTEIGDFQVSDNNWGFVYGEENENLLYKVNIKGQLLGPYVDAWDLQITDKNWGFVYQVNGQDFININGKPVGPYYAVGSLQLSYDNWSFWYHKDSSGLDYVSIRGQEYGPYKWVHSPSLKVADKNWMFMYIDTDAPNHLATHYVNVNGQVLGPYGNFFGGVVSEHNWGFIFSQYEDGQDRYYIQYGLVRYGQDSEAGVADDGADSTNGQIGPENQNASHVLMRAEGDEKVYKILGGKRLFIPNELAFEAQGLSWGDITVVSPESLEVMPRIKLIKGADEKIFYFTESGLKRHIPNETVFLSYGNKWEDIVSVSQTELDSISNNDLIKLSGSNSFYKLENGKKRLVEASAFVRLGVDRNKVAPVNQTEFNGYPTGSSIN